jgi:hypothetical protein
MKFKDMVLISEMCHVLMLLISAGWLLISGYKCVGG